MPLIQVRSIDSLEGPELKPYRTMRQQGEHRDEGIFVAEGDKVVQRLLETDITVLSVLMPDKWLGHLDDLLQARPEPIIAYVAPKPELEKLTGFSMYQGVLAVARIPEPPSLEQILSIRPRPLLMAAVDGLTNAENLGGLVRNCAAFSVQALLVGETSSSPYLRRAVRGSMGTIFQVPALELTNLAETIRFLRTQNVRCIAAHPHTDQKRLSQADFSGDSCIVFGSEGYGISAAVLEACDEAVAIPMPPRIDSLNVGSAAAVFLYEAARQRGRA